MLRRLREQRPSFRTFSSSGGGGGSSGGSGGGGGGGGGGSGSGGFGLWAAYLGLLSKRPLATKAVTAALLNGLGDVIAQRQFEQGKEFDWKRCSIFTLLVRACGCAPCCCKPCYVVGLCLCCVVLVWLDGMGIPTWGWRRLAGCPAGMVGCISAHEPAASRH